MAFGFYHTLFITNTFSVYSFGGAASAGALGFSGNNVFEPVLIPGLRNVNASEVAAGSGHSLVLSNNGTLYVFGSNNAGQLGLGDTTARSIPVILPFGSSIKQVSSFYQNTLFLTSDNKAYGMGHNDYGAMGQGDTVNKLSPVYIIDNVTQVSSGGFHSVFLKTDSKIFVCGRGRFGALGDNQTTFFWTTPQLLQFSLTQNIIKVFAGFEQTFYLTQEKTVFATGTSKNGELGLGPNITLISYPQKLPLTNIRDLSLGYFHVIFLTETNQVYATGDNLNGQQGIGTYDSRSVPILVDFSSERPVSKIFTGKANSVFLTYDFGLFYCGGKLGSNYIVPTPMYTLNSSTRNHAIFTGWYNTFIIKGDKREVFSTGYNSFYNLGLNTINDMYSPIKTLVLENVTSISAGFRHSFALDSLGRLYGFGDDTFGQMGKNDVNGLSLGVPTRFNFPFTVTKVTTGQYTSHFLTSDGRVFGTGYNTVGQVGVNVTSNLVISWTLLPINAFFGKVINITDISSSYLHTLLMSNESEVFSFGYGPDGALGRNLTSSSNRPVKVLGLDSIQVNKIFACGYTSFVVSKDNKVYSFGANVFGVGLLNKSQDSVLLPTLSPFSFPDTITKISCSEFHTLVLTTTSVYAAGRNFAGQLGFGDFTDRVNLQLIPIINPLDISAGIRHSVILNQCNNGNSGPLCQYPFCFGISGGDESNVCSGQGKCIATNICSCYEPSFGDKCQFNEFVWREKISGKWSNARNWQVRRGNDLVETLSYPLTDDSAIISEDGSYTITLDVPVSLSSLTIGTNSRVSLIIRSTELNITNSLSTPTNSLIESVSSKLIINRAIINGTFTLKNSYLKGNISLNNRFLMNETNQFNELTLNCYQDVIIDSQITINSTTINMYSNTNHITNGFINLDRSNLSTSIIRNFGSYLINAYQRDIYLQMMFINLNTLNVFGNYTIYMNEYRQSSPKSYFNFYDSKIISNQSMTIDSGYLYLGGVIETPIFTYSSKDGDIKLFKDLNIIGNATFTEKTTFLYILNGVNNELNYKVTSTGNLILLSFILVNLGNGYNPKVGDQIEFAKFDVSSTYSQNLYLFGSPYKNAEVFHNNGALLFKVVFSIGSVSLQGYKCSYLGKKKIFERNYFEEQGKIILSLTTPLRDGIVGFGFDLNGTVSSSLLILSTFKNGLFEISQFYHNQTLKGPTYLSIGSTKSQSIFNIGPEYLTISLLVSSDYLHNQNYIYYSEFPYENNSINLNISRHYSETYKFNILNPESSLECTNFLQPSRVEIYNIPITVLLLLFYLFLFALCCIFVRFRPLNTRGISPFLTLFFLFLQLLLEIRNYFEIPEYQGSLCVFYSYSVYPLILICFLIILLYFWRYFAIINLNENKKNIYQKISLKNEIPIIQKVKSFFLKAIASTWFAIISLILSFILIILIFTIIMAADSFICKFSTLITLKTIHNLELILIYFLTFLTLILDMIPNYKLIIKCKWIDYIFYNDPYYFRVQIILFLPFIIYTLIVELYILSTTSNYSGVIIHHTPIIWLNTISFAFLLIIDVIFPLLITMIEFFIDKCLPKQKPPCELEVILKNKGIIYDLFESFCNSEFSIENLACWNDIQQFKKDKKDFDVIFHKYLNGKRSPMEININYAITKEILNDIFNEKITENLFENVEKECYLNMMDNWFRFIQWDQKYKDYVKNQKSEIELVEGKKKKIDKKIK